MGGPAVKEIETEDGETVFETLPVNAVFTDRDKKTYPATIIREYAVPILVKNGDGQTNEKRQVADLSVNFGRGKREDWKTLNGVSKYEDNFNTFKKPFYAAKDVEASAPEPKAEKKPKKEKPKAEKVEAPAAPEKTDAPAS